MTTMLLSQDGAEETIPEAFSHSLSPAVLAAVVSVVEVQAVAVLEASAVAEVSEAAVLREGGNFKIFLKSLLIISLFSIVSCQTQKTSFNPKKITNLRKLVIK